MPSRPTYVVKNWQDVLFSQCFRVFHCMFCVFVYTYIHIYHIFFIPSSIDGHVGCFHILAFVNNAALNVGINVSLQDPVFISFGLYPELGLLDHMVPLFLMFWGTSILFSIMALPIYIPTNSAQGFPFLYFLSNTCLSFVFLIIAILTGVRWYITVVLIYIFLMASDSEYLSMYLLAVWLSVCLLCKNVYSVPLLILKSDFLFLAIEL